MRTLAFSLIAISVLIAPPFVHAADDGPNYAEETLTGDWGGTRSTLAQKGLALDIGYKADLLRNMSGGIQRGGRAMTHLDIGLSANFDTLFGWSGASAYVNLIHDGGSPINTRQVGSHTGVSNIEVGTNTHRLLHAWVQQEFADGRGAILAGLYPIDSEFQIVDSAGVFVQPPYGASADIALTRTPSVFNTSSFGFRAKWLSADHSAYAQGAVLDGIPGDPNNPRGTHIRFDKGDGIMSIVEIGLKPGDSTTAPTPELVEKYAAGLWRYSARVPDQFDTNADGSAINRLSWGWYALAEKTLLPSASGADLAGFVRISGTDGDSTAIRNAVNVGIRVNGLLPGRDQDTLGLAYTRASLSTKWRSAQQALGTATTSYEDAWELTYRIQATKWLALQPVIQHISHPGGDATIAAANIAGVRVELVF